MMWNLGRSAASPDGRPGLDSGSSAHFGGQNLARFKNAEFDRLYQRISTIPDGPEREQLFFEAKRLMAAYAPYRFHVHRILTDLAWPWVKGFRRPPYWLPWWQYVDLDVSDQAKAIQ